MLGGVSFGPAACALGDVAHHGLGGANELVAAIGVSTGERLDDLDGEGQELDGTLIDVQAFSAEHERFSAARAESCFAVARIVEKMSREGSTNPEP
jgi:hypothetical protein